MKKINKKIVDKYIFVIVMLSYFLILFAIFWVGVNINSFLLAFQNIRYTPDGYVSTFDAGFDNFTLFLNDFFDGAKNGGTIVWNGILNSVKLWGISTLINLPLSLIFSYFVFRKIWGYNVYRTIFMMPSIISGFVFCLIFRKMVDGGLITQIWANVKGEAPSLLRDPQYNFGVILFYTIWLGFGTRTIVYTNAMKDIPDEVLESAKIDGVDNMFSEMWYMIVPLIWPTISTFLITGMAGMLMASGPLLEFYGVGNVPRNVYTLGFYYTEQLLNGGSGNETMFPYLAAGGLILSAVAIALTYLVRWGCNKLEKKWHG